MFNKHISCVRAVAAPALSAMVLLLLASGEAEASGKRHARAASGTVTFEHVGGLRGSRVASVRGRGRRTTFQTHC